MSYIQDCLKGLLGGIKLSVDRSGVINDWTPNNVKSIIIGRDCMMVVYHIGGFGGCRLIRLDSSRVMQEVADTTGGYPRINAVLNRRSLTCLEELYVDTIYLSNPLVVDVGRYVSENVGDSSRFRFYGFGSFCYGDMEYVRSAYARSRGDYDYALALDRGCPFRIEYKGSGNAGWYRSYYLRPQYYKLDEEGGKLDTHFRKIEREYRSYRIDKDSGRYISAIVSVDEGNARYFRLFDRFLGIIVGSRDVVRCMVLNVVNKVLLDSWYIRGLKDSYVRDVCSEYVFKCYKNFNVLDNSSKNELDFNCLSRLYSSHRGFIDIRAVLDCICCDIIELLPKEGYPVLTSTALMVNEDFIPKGRVRELYYNGSEPKNGSIEGYYRFLEEIVGCYFVEG